MNLNLNIAPLETWVNLKKKPLVIAGPCSAETPEQLMATARGLQSLKVDIIRAGIWKPRTRPNSFEGAGEEGLKWLADVKKELNIPVGTEVANPEHIELALKHNIDVLWIGARTTVSPFAVQEMADALRGVKNVAVLVKNPTHPELNLWIGAFERLNQAGITNLGAIHRGFATYDKSKFRNQPVWQIPIELRRIAPQIPIICDPSHITGKRDLIFEISQKAMDLNFDGLMIETHITPDKAWSDADQQITPEKLGEILSELKIRVDSTSNQVFNDHLEDLRSKIDNIDRELVEILAQRMAVVEKIGEYKKENNITTFQVKRWDEIMKNRAELAKKMGLNPEFVTEIYKIIHEESIRKQTEIMKAVETKA
ncbi:MAG: bifunctional 3-deoxy-7-phosphoheptulonate synthase/chorismate mutase type II [Cytophagaceae bacterium]|nr:bifunctional 3-deoxy-7-phosphoheptulonate synthase/chorismate mutase type II [Cytophagaceae bacterium]MDW8456541.1 bifunctional 3-deoxy-7-phosphoheptulonate synthase/chorismate mutase type II [Cytophagaceae bacterium]